MDGTDLGEAERILFFLNSFSCYFLFTIPSTSKTCIVWKYPGKERRSEEKETG